MKAKSIFFNLCMLSLFISGCSVSDPSNVNEQSSLSSMNGIENETEKADTPTKRASDFENVSFAEDVIISNISLADDCLSFVFANNSDDYICYGPDEFFLEVYEDGWRDLMAHCFEHETTLCRLDTNASVTRQHIIRKSFFPELYEGGNKRYRLIEKFCYGREPSKIKEYACVEFVI